MPTRPSSTPASRFLQLLLVVVIACAVPGVRCSDRRFPHLDRVRELHRREGSSSAEQEAAARGLLARLLPSHSTSFEFRVISTVCVLCCLGIVGSVCDVVMLNASDVRCRFGVA